MLFRDRTEAGRVLADRLAAYANYPDAMVLALPRGGVAPIARHRAHRAPIRHHCSVALAKDARDGRIDFPISTSAPFPLTGSMRFSAECLACSTGFTGS